MMLGLFILVLPIVAPVVMAWLFARRYRQKLKPGWKLAGIALAIGIIPAVMLFALLSGFWIIGFDGRCGGWLGETAPCTFVQFASETMYWGALTLLIPAFIGLMLSVIFLFVKSFFYRHRSGSEP